MKKYPVFLIAFILVSVLLLSGILQSVTAESNPGPTATPAAVEDGIADGDWSSGNVITVDLSKNKAPKSYLQLLGDGVTVSTSGRICHPFRGGVYGWSGSIYQLIGSKWNKVTTYFAWIPDEEGTFMACTYGYAGGIYALFGVYTASANPTATLPPTATPTKTPTPKPTAKPPSGGPTQMNRT